MEKVRVFFADKGFRHYDIVLRTVEWTGQTAGEGNYEVNDYPLTIQGRRIGVGLVKTADVVASGGEYTDIDYRIGPITPTYSDPLATFPTGGMDVSDFDLPVETTKRQIYFRLTGPGIEDGAWFKKNSQEVHRNWSYVFTVRKTAEIPPDPPPQ